jgi:arabinofuranosyltransferase
LTTQCFYYLEEPFSSDPTTFLILAPLLVLPVLILLEYKTTIGRQSLAFVRQHLPLILGITFYAAYLVRIGGDFMSGRMLTSLFLCTLILWTQVSWKPRLQGWVWGGFTLIVVLSGLLSPFPTVFSDAHYREGTPFWKFIDTAGVADERGFYYQATSLLNTLESGKPPLWKNDWANEGRSWRYANQRLVVTTSIGFRGYYAGPAVHIVDTFALADSLLARLPILPGARWRIGHFERALPCGYLETLESGRNVIQNPNLALYYDKLSLVTRGPLFSLQRLREIWNLNTEKYSYLIQSYIPSPCREPSSLLHPP